MGAIGAVPSDGGLSDSGRAFLSFPGKPGRPCSSGRPRLFRKSVVEMIGARTPRTYRRRLLHHRCDGDAVFRCSEARPGSSDVARAGIRFIPFQGPLRSVSLLGAGHEGLLPARLVADLHAAPFRAQRPSQSEDSGRGGQHRSARFTACRSVSARRSRRGFPARTGGPLWRSGTASCRRGPIGKRRWQPVIAGSTIWLPSSIAIVSSRALEPRIPIGLIRCRRKWTAFGWEAIEVDGHDHGALYDVFTRPGRGKPIAVIANSIKGQGRFLHRRSRANGTHKVPSPEQIKLALEELSR